MYTVRCHWNRTLILDKKQNYINRVSLRPTGCKRRQLLCRDPRVLSKTQSICNKLRTQKTDRAWSGYARDTSMNTNTSIKLCVISSQKKNEPYYINQYDRMEEDISHWGVRRILLLLFSLRYIERACVCVPPGCTQWLFCALSFCRTIPRSLVTAGPAF